MRLRYRLLCVFTVLLLLISASCKKNVPDSSTDATTTENSTDITEPGDNTETTSDVESPATDNGSTSKISDKTTRGGTSKTQTPTNKMDFSKLKNTTLRVAIFTEPAETDKKVASEFEAKYGCKVQYDVISWSQFQTKLVQIVNSGTRLDYIKLSDQEFVNYVAQKLIQPIDPYIDINNKYFSKAFMDMFKWKNQRYVMYNPASYYSSYVFIFYNKTMFEDEGETEPYEHYKRGNWTFEQFRKTAKAMTKDTNKDGKPDILGFGTWWYDAFLLANGNTQVKLNQNGSIDITLQSQNAYNAMQLIENMQLVDHSYDWNVNPQEKFLNSQMAMMLERPWEAVGAYNMYNKDVFPDEIGIVPVPKGPDAGNTYYAPVLIHGYGIPSSAKNPLGAVAWFLHSAEYSEKRKNDPEVIKNRRRMLSDEHLKIVDEFISKSTPINSFSNSIGSWYTTKWELWSGILRDNIPPATAVAQKINLLKNEISKTLNQGGSGVIND